MFLLTDIWESLWTYRCLA